MPSLDLDHSTLSAWPDFAMGPFSERQIRLACHRMLEMKVPLEALAVRVVLQPLHLQGLRLPGPSRFVDGWLGVPPTIRV